MSMVCTVSHKSCGAQNQLKAKEGDTLLQEAQGSTCANGLYAGDSLDSTGCSKEVPHHALCGVHPYVVSRNRLPQCPV